MLDKLYTLDITQYLLNTVLIDLQLELPLKLIYNKKQDIDGKKPAHFFFKATENTNLEQQNVDWDKQ